MGSNTLIAKEDEYEIKVDGALHLLELKITGIIDPELMPRYTASIDEALAFLAKRGCSQGSHLMLVDLSEGIVQSQETVRSLSAAAGRANSPKREAIVVSGALVKMQARRVVQNVDFFDDRETAVR